MDKNGGKKGRRFGCFLRYCFFRCDGGKKGSKNVVRRETKEKKERKEILI
jgi:hypothetical protein